MEKSLTRQTFGLPSQSVLEHKFARLSEAENVRVQGGRAARGLSRSGAGNP